MNKLEKDIIGILEEDARTSPKDIAVILGISQQEVEKTIKKLEDQGVIAKYTVIVNNELINKDLVEALIEVKVSPMKDSGFDAIAEQIYQFPEVKSVYLMSGSYDLHVRVEGSTLKEVALFVSQKLSSLDKVLSTSTHFILKKYKYNGVLLESSDSVKRLAIHV